MIILIIVHMDAVIKKDNVFKMIINANIDM